MLAGSSPADGLEVILHGARLPGVRVYPEQGPQHVVFMRALLPDAEFVVQHLEGVGAGPAPDAVPGVEAVGKVAKRVAHEEPTAGLIGAAGGDGAEGRGLAIPRRGHDCGQRHAPGHLLECKVAETGWERQGAGLESLPDGLLHLRAANCQNSAGV